MFFPLWWKWKWIENGKDLHEENLGVSFPLCSLLCLWLQLNVSENEGQGNMGEEKEEGKGDGEREGRDGGGGWGDWQNDEVAGQETGKNDVVVGQR